MPKTGLGLGWVFLGGLAAAIVHAAARAHERETIYVLGVPVIQIERPRRDP